MKIMAILLLAPFALLSVLLISLLLAWPFEIAWNYAVPFVFGLKSLTLMQAWALSFVGGSLFKSVSHGKN